MGLKFEKAVTDYFFDVFPEHVREKAGTIFDESDGAGEDQIIINALAGLLVALNSYDEDDDSLLNCKLLNYIKALEAAYRLGAAMKSTTESEV